MLKHILLFKLKPEANGKDRSANAAELKARLEALKGKIPQIAAIEAGVNARYGGNSYDVSLYSEFKNFADLDIYRAHPAHVEVLKFIEDVCEARWVVDYESE